MVLVRVMLVYAALLLCATTGAYKIAIFAPEMANSQVIFNARVAEELADAGHSVTLFLLRFSRNENPKVAVKSTVSTYIVDAIPEKDHFAQFNAIQKETTYKSPGMFDSNTRKIFPLMMATFVDGCEKTLQNKQFLSDLRAGSFDLAFTPVFDLCFAGIVRHVGIPSWIWLSSGALIDPISSIIGVPSPPSYVPSIIQQATDHMTFFQRLTSFMLWNIQPIMYPRVVIDPETALFRKYIDPNFPDLREIGKQCALVMVNSNELYDLARPTLHKVVYIGGIGMKNEKAQPLTGVWPLPVLVEVIVRLQQFKELVDKSEKLVLMSFGSIANASLMPADWKTAFLGAFRRFPDYQFILRYDTRDLEGKLPSNVHTFKWLPQRDLMQNAKVKALISHGGYNSMQETINAGKPLVAVPLFADQPRNALIAEKFGIGVSVDKAELNEEKLVQALNAVLKEKRYAEMAEQMHHMVRLKPVSPEHLLTHWTEFVAEFKQLPNLTPQGIHLNIIQYLCLDVIAFLVAIVCMVLYIVYRVIRCVYGFCRRKLFGAGAGGEKSKQKKH